MGVSEIAILLVLFVQFLIFIIFLFKLRQQFDQHLLNSLTTQQNTISQTFTDIRNQIQTTLNQNTDNLTKQFENLTYNTKSQLQEISGLVEKRLSEGFEKTTATFSDVIKRLALIDQAQKKITELSNNVVSLQDILIDKRARGAFGEVQLNSLIKNLLPSSDYSLQHTLSNGKRADCILWLPAPTGNVCIDAKFPLETYQRLMNTDNSDADKRNFSAQFRKDIKHHIKNITEKYIISGETADGAIMFIPAEAIFAEIHANYPDLVDIAHKSKVWLVSPTTMMAVITTARAVLKDEATRKQIHVIQEHLRHLSDDFSRFQTRMRNLANHIDMAQKDVHQVNISAKKIHSRFDKIEKVQLDNTHVALETSD